MLPIGVAPLVPEPVSGKQDRAIEPLLPHLAPPLAHDRGVGRQRVVHDECRAPDQVFIEEAAAHIVRVIGVAVVGGTERDDRFERRRRAGGHLERIESAPGNSEHANGTVAPGLGREPGDHRDRVVVL